MIKRSFNNISQLLFWIMLIMALIPDNAVYAKDPSPDLIEIADEEVSGNDVSPNDPDIPAAEEKSIPEHEELLSVSSETALEDCLSFVKKQKLDITPYFSDTEGISYYKIEKKERKYATVSKSGKLKAIKNGSVNVLAIGQDKTVLKSLSINVVAPKLTFSSVCNSLNDRIDPKESLTDITVSPSSWSTTTPKICSVDPETGMITPLKRGDAVIVAHYAYGTNTVKIKGKLKIRIPVISAKKLSLPLNKTKKLTLKKIPDASIPVEWNSGDVSIATVDPDGRVHPVAKGTTSVNALYNGMCFSCQVTVKAPQKKTSGTFKIDLGNGRTATVTGHYDTAFSNELFRLVNEYRQQNGLPALKKDDELEESGYLRARETSYMFSHTRPNGESCFTAFPRSYRAAGENIAAGQPTAADMFRTWKNSPGHNANMLDPNFTHASMVVFILEGDSHEGFNYVYYGVQCFIGR